MIGTNTPPLNQWREVCRWDEPSIFDDLGTLEYGPQSEPMSDEELAVAKDEALKMVLGERDFELLRQMAELWPTSMELWEAFQNMAACYEELAGEHRELWEAFMRDAEALSTPCPGDPEDYTFVRAYYRPRRSKLAAIDPDQGTVQAAPGEGQSGASGGQPEAFSIDLNPDETGVVTNAVSLAVDHDCTVTNFQGVEGKDWHYTEAFQWQGEVQCPIPQSGEERIE